MSESGSWLGESGGSVAWIWLVDGIPAAHAATRTATRDPETRVRLYRGWSDGYRRLRSADLRLRWAGGGLARSSLVLCSNVGWRQVCCDTCQDGGMLRAALIFHGVVERVGATMLVGTKRNVEDVVGVHEY